MFKSVQNCRITSTSVQEQSKNQRVLKNDEECSRAPSNVQECSRGVVECSMVFKLVQVCLRVFKSGLECSKAFGHVQECSRMLWKSKSV